MSSNIQRLGETIDGRMKKAASAAIPMGVELGTINSNLSLITDSLKTPIPKGDYMICLTLTGGYDTNSTIHSHDEGEHVHSGGVHGGHDSGNGSHTHDGGAHNHVGGAHTHRLPETFRNVKAGDRVLVAWCGNEPVVISIVVSS